MKVLLGMLARSDRTREPYLDRVLTIMCSSFDGVEVLEDGGVPIANFSAQRNRLIEFGEREGYDWMFMLDSDECMFPEDIARVRALMTGKARLIFLPRIDFAKDMQHTDPTPYPDWQGRVFKLGMGYRFRRRLHEGLYRRFAIRSEFRLKRGLFSPDTPIYHYGRLRTLEEMELRNVNYPLIAGGKPAVAKLPADVVLDPNKPYWVELRPFEGRHPLQDG